MVEGVSLNLSAVCLPSAADEFIAAGLKRGKEIDWFDFVASDYQAVFTLLNALQRGRFCEWGSGIGIVTGLAEMLGYDATGIEFHEPLVTASRQFLSQFGLRSSIELEDVFLQRREADLYFAYLWPGKVAETEQHFRQVAPVGSRLLVYYGPADVRWIQK